MFRDRYSRKLVVFVLLANLTLLAVPAGAQSSGIDVAGMNRSVDPGDDFFGYANGAWFRSTEIPADRSSLGIFQNIANEVNKRNAALITDANQAAGCERFGHRGRQRTRLHLAFRLGDLGFDLRKTEAFIIQVTCL